jgi:hypothetical protein
MNTPSTRTDTAMARPRIRAGQTARTRETADLKAIWHRMLGSPSKPMPMPMPGQVALQVEVATQAGRRLFVLRDPEGTVDLALGLGPGTGTGTDDILVLQGSLRRRDTVPLGPVASFDLDLVEAPAGDALRAGDGHRMGRSPCVDNSTAALVTTLPMAGTARSRQLAAVNTLLKNMAGRWDRPQS